MLIKYLNYTATLFFFVSALLWAISAKVNFTFGYDMDKELNKAMNRASKLNAWAAGLTALAIFIQTIAATLSQCSD